MSFDTPRTKTLARLIEKEGPSGTGRIVGLSIEADGVFIYTNSREWCDDSGSGTFRGDSETAAVRRFAAMVQPAEQDSAEQDSAEQDSAEQDSAEQDSAARRFVSLSVTARAPHNVDWRYSAMRQGGESDATRRDVYRFADGSAVTFTHDGLPVEFIG